MKTEQYINSETNHLNLGYEDNEIIISITSFLLIKTQGIISPWAQ